MNKLKIYGIFDKTFWFFTLLVLIMWLLNIVPIEMSILALLMYHHYYVLEKLEEIKNQEIKVNIYNENEKKLILEKKEKIYSWNEEEK